MDSKRHVPPAPRGGGWLPVLAGMLLLGVLPAGKAAAQNVGLFRSVETAAVVATPGFESSPDSLTVRRRLVVIDFGQLTPPVDTAAVGAGAAGPSGVLRLNLFDDATFTGLVRVPTPFVL